MNVSDAVRRCRALGHGPDREASAEEILEAYQKFHGLPVTGWLCGETVEHLARPRCAHPDVLAYTAGESRWALPAIEYYQQVAYPGIDPATIAAEYAEACRRMASVCGITIAPATSPAGAQVLATSGPIDGEWNILALTELPPPDAGRGTVLHQTFDAAEVGLTSEQRIAMMAHECGHYLGLGHATPGSGNLMEPVLGTISSPQAGDTAELQDRYGPPGSSPVPTPPAPPTAQNFTVDVAAANEQFVLTFDQPGRWVVTVAPLPS